MKDIPAFPLHNHGTQTLGMHFTGMTLRDYFAASFVKSGTVFPTSFPVNTPDRVAKQAYELADAMMKAREL
jgi:hypothetical protein